MISDNLRQAAYAQDTDVAIIVLLTFTNPLTDDEPVRISSVPVEKFTDLGENVYGVTSNGERYLFFPFEIQLPQDDKTGTVSATLSIENVSREIIQFARQTRNLLNVTVQVVLSNNLDYVEMEYKDFKLRNINYDALTISGDLSIDYLGLEPFPAGRFTPSGFPGLF